MYHVLYILVQVVYNMCLATKRRIECDVVLHQKALQARL